ncbi:MAG TPA: CsbD family protein [Acidimicrobiia bacterium]|jgi:uncharacterized protein YjbJ (UPF0337 family)
MQPAHDYETDWEDRLADEGRWQQARGRIRKMWGKLTDQELEEARGSWDGLVGKIKEVTGETTDSVQTKLQDIFA